MPGVLGIAGSGIGTLGASAGYEAFAIGPGSCANDHSLAIGIGVEAVSNTLCIGNKCICCVWIGRYDFGRELELICECLCTLNTCLLSVAACASGATSCATIALSCANNAMTCANNAMAYANNAMVCAQNAVSSANSGFNQLCCCRREGNSYEANLTASGRCLIWYPKVDYSAS